MRETEGTSIETERKSEDNKLKESKGKLALAAVSGPCARAEG